MAYVNLKSEEVLSKILNDLIYEESYNIEDIASLAFDDEIDVWSSASFNFDDPDNVNGADQTSQVMMTMQVLLELHSDVSLLVIGLINNLEKALNEQNYNTVSLKTTEKRTSYSKKPKPLNTWGYKQPVNCVLKLWPSEAVKYYQR